MWGGGSEIAPLKRNVETTGTPGKTLMGGMLGWAEMHECSPMQRNPGFSDCRGSDFFFQNGKSHSGRLSSKNIRRNVTVTMSTDIRS